MSVYLRYATADRKVAGISVLWRFAHQTDIRCRSATIWRCVSRLEFGTKYCHHSPTLDEDRLHAAILEALNEFAQAGSEVKEDMETAGMMKGWTSWRIGPLPHCS